MAGALYYVKALTLSEVEIEEGDDMDELEQAIKEGIESVATLFDEYDNALSVDLASSEVVGYEIVSADGVVIAKSGQEIPDIVRV